MSLLVLPSEKRTDLVARPRLDGQTLRVRLGEEHNAFKAVVKSLHMHWSGHNWQRKIGNLAGDPQDRLVELAHRLLVSGFPVEFENEELKDRAVAGDFEPECRRWILVGKSGEFEGWLRMWWGYGEPDFYKRAQFLTGTRYDHKSHCVVAPPESFAEVEDFAAMHGFSVHPEARVIIDTQRVRFAQAEVVEVQGRETEPLPTWSRPRLKASDVEVPRGHLDFQSPPVFEVTTELLPHQVPAVEHVAPLKIGGLFMDMGTGKTRCAIEIVKRRQARISRVVWFCPVSLKSTAVHEILKHTNVDPSEIYVFDDETKTSVLPKATWYIVGLESISGSDRVTLTANQLIDGHTMVIIDESSYIKGHASKRTLRVTQMAQAAAYRLILTGTPLSQGVEDLFAQMRFLSPEILGYNSFYSFAANHLEYHPDYPGLVVRAHNTDHLAAKVAPYIYQVTKDEVGLDLPEKIYDARYFDLTDQQLERYQQAKEEILFNLRDDDIDSYVIFQLFGALQQIASGFWVRDGELLEIEHRRLETLRDILERIGEQEPMIVWCKYVHSVRQIAGTLEGAALYYGDLSEQEREEEITRWREGDARFLIATMATGGHGLTLTEARYAIFYENSFKYAERVQAEDRIHRIGQTRRPTYIDLFANCGIEQRIEMSLARKENVVKAFKRDVNRAKTRNLVENL